MENRGKFIVIDGTDGSGKTTQLEILKDKLESEGHEVKVADFPQYNTKSAGMVEEYLSGKYGQADEVGPYKASIFYAVDRFDASEKIKKWLSNGKIVLANRYTSASLGHQGGKIENSLERRLFFNWLYDLEYKIFEIPKPDLTIVLQVEPEISFKLAKDRNREDWKGKTKDIHENNLDHLKKAEQTYIEIASSLPDFKLIKCTHNKEMLSPEAIHFLVWLTTSQIIKKKEQTKNFQAIGSIMGSNKHIVNNRELILNKEIKQNNNTTTTSEIVEDIKNNNKNKEESNTKLTTDPYGNKGLDTSISNKESESKKEEINTEEEVDNNSEKKLIVKKINKQAVLPKKGHQNDAAYDLFSNDYYSIPAYGQALVSTGIKMEIPNGYAGLIWDKSGLANEGITTMGGVIDSSYRGEIKVIVKNLSEDIFNIIPGQKIAQILIQKIEQLEIEEGEININTDRQDKGFGSTGKF
jgi:dTMP kinase